MRRSAAIVGLVAVVGSGAGCASSFDAKAQARSLGATVSAPTKHEGQALAPRPRLSLERFAMVKVARDVDITKPLPATVTLPFDAHVERVEKTDRGGGKRRAMHIRLPGDYTRFEREVGDPITQALTDPSSSTSLVFRYEVQRGVARYEAFAVEVPPIATTADLEGAEIIPWGHVSTDRPRSAAREETELVAVRVTLREAARARLEAQRGSTVLYLIDGRTVRKDEVFGDPRRSANGLTRDVNLVFEWPDRAEAERAVSALTRAVSGS